MLLCKTTQTAFFEGLSEQILKTLKYGMLVHKTFNILVVFCFLNLVPIFPKNVYARGKKELKLQEA